MKALGRCDDCGAPYPVEVTEDSMRATGNAGACRCGRRGFSAVTEAEVGAKP